MEYSYTSIGISEHQFGVTNLIGMCIEDRLLHGLMEEYVKSRVIEWLGKHDYVITSVKTLAEHGVDIRAKKARSNNLFIIECKGEPKQNPRYRYPILVSALGEIVQRVKYQRHCRYAIALPETYKELVTGKIPWVANKRLSLEILLVSSNGAIDRISWQRLMKIQTK